MARCFHFLSKFFNSSAYETITWFLKDFVLRYKYYLAAIVAFGFSAASIQGGVLFLINGLVTKSQVATNLHNFFLKLDIHIKLEFFVFLIIIIGLTLSASFVFLQAKLTLKLWRKYQVHLTNSLLKELHGAVGRGVDIDENSIKASPISSVLKGTQRMGAFTRLVINSILPFMRFLIFSAFAFYSQPQISMFVFFVVIPTGALVLFFSAKRASANDYQSEALAQNSSNEFTKRIEAALNGERYLINATTSPSESYITLRLDKLLSSLIVAERSRFLMSLLTIVILVIVTTFGGLVHNSSNIVELLIYLVALIMAFSQLSNVLMIASHFGRFYPTVYRYRVVYKWLVNAKSGSLVADMLSNSSYQYASSTNSEDLIE